MRTRPTRAGKRAGIQMGIGFRAGIQVGVGTRAGIQVGVGLSAGIQVGVGLRACLGACLDHRASEEVRACFSRWVGFGHRASLGAVEVCVRHGLHRGV